MSDLNGVSDSNEQRSILTNSAIMAVGTIFSRLSGLIRGILLAAILGASLRLDMFQIANTIPNILYVVLAGGVFNAVLVPQLVRTAKEDSDGGTAYLNRVITLSMLFLGFATVALIVAAPALMDLYLNARFQTPELAAQRDSVIALARWCLPQVFFYGMFTLVGQVLNARGKFGPMMWAPIANNLVAIVALIGYWWVFGAASAIEERAPFSSAQTVVLGLSATAGIVLQFLILLPYCRAAGVRFRPRFDFANAGIKHTLKLGGWTAGFVVVNQIALAVIVKLGSGATAESTEGTGYGIYSLTYPLMILPHSIVTVSLTTAILPVLAAKAANSDLLGLKATLTQAMRNTFAIVLPVAVMVPIFAPELARLIWGFGAAADSVHRFVPSLALWGLAVPFFTLHYLCLRGFYALEQNRTVFFIQCVIAATNITLATTLVNLASPAQTSPALVVAYTLSYLVGSTLSYGVLRYRLGAAPVRASRRFGTESSSTGSSGAGSSGPGSSGAGSTGVGPSSSARPTPEAAFLPRLMLAVSLTTMVAFAAVWLGRLVTAALPPWPAAAGSALGAGLLAIVCYWLLARRLQLREVTEVVATIRNRGRKR